MRNDTDAILESKVVKFTYAYKTGDGLRHVAQMDATSRDEVFAELRRRGIRAIKVFAEDGSRANGEMSGVRKHVVVAIVAAVAISVGAVAYFGGVRSVATADASVQEALNSSVRRQIIGDTAVIEKGIRTGWADVFGLEGNRFFASFAIPGVPVAVRSTTEDEIRKALATDNDQTSDSRSSLEARQIVSIVEGMKRELRAFLEQGGSVSAYGRKLVSRQEEEIGHYNRAKTEVENAIRNGANAQQIMDLWEQKNESLRQMGIRLIPFPY